MLAVRFRLGLLLVALLVRRFIVGIVGRRFADRDTVIEPEHDDNGVSLFGGENALGGGGPIGRIALRLIFDQAGDRPVSADYAHVRLFGIGVFKTIGEPVGHGITEHKNVALRYSVAFLRRRRLRIILAHRRWCLPPIPTRLGRLLLERIRRVITKPAATKPAVTTLLLRPLLKSAEIEELR